MPVETNTPQSNSGDYEYITFGQMSPEDFFNFLKSKSNPEILRIIRDDHEFELVWRER